MADLPVISFSYNWNNKLDCKAFTTLRLHNPSKYQVGSKYQIYKGNEFKCVAIIEGIRVLKASKINEFIAFLDTGYDVAECRNIIRRMYKNQADPVMDLILLVKIKG